MKHAFVFIEVFGCEGGIQSYIQDVLSAYGQIAGSSAIGKVPLSADVFLLRDSKGDCPAEDGCFRYHSFKSSSPMMERVRLTLALGICLLRDRPEHVFCGHINLAVMVSQLCRIFKISYTVLTYGKEVWCELSAKEKQALMCAERIWTISRYSRDLACQANQISRQKFDLLPCVVDGTTFMPGPASEALITRYRLEMHGC